MTRNEIFLLLGIELKKSRKEHPSWPDHVVAQSAMVTMAAGKLTSSAIDIKYDLNPNEVVRDVQKERLVEDAIKTAVTAIRFLENLK